jgi:hypothetical protein
LSEESLLDERLGLNMAESSETAPTGRSISAAGVEAAPGLLSDAKRPLRSSESTDEAQTGPGDTVVLPYEHFLTERRAIVDARQRVQQRIDQLVSGGAAGALVLSISFLDNIAEHPAQWTERILILAWSALILSLAANLLGHFGSERAFEDFLKAFDQAFVEKRECRVPAASSKIVRLLEITSALLFVIGVSLLSWFAVVNLSM